MSITNSLIYSVPLDAAFEFDLVARAGLSILPVTTMDFQEFEEDSDTIPQHAYYPNRMSLDAAVERYLQQGITPRVLLLSHPHNPLGICYPPEVVKEIIDWCRENRIHLVSDEIYAGSVYRQDANFISALELASTGDDHALGLGPYIHFVYALSKDFALSGLRVGALYSENPEIRLPLQKLNDLCCISSQTQLLVEKMLTTSSDDPNVSWVNRFRTQSHIRLRKRCDAWHSCLDELDIPYLKATAGLFVWMDFSEFLPDEGTDNERERTLYLELVKEHGLLFTPGQSMKNERPGFFRCVFTAASDEEFDLGMDRLRKYVSIKREL
jgi:aspartate/methionine/tyrosine aminotransferase